jgi:hypothetical protein
MLGGEPIMPLQKKICITQSNYIPWKGYFDNIKQVDIFVVYDDMQYTKRDWRNRNLIKTEQGLKWLTIPVEVKGKYFQKIKDTKIADKNWNLSHLAILKQSYKQAPCYKEMIEWLEEMYLNCTYVYLTDINSHFIQSINNFLSISSEIRYSSEFELVDGKTERLIDICTHLEVTDYYSGPSAKSYIDSEKFFASNIDVHYFDYGNYPIYHQLHGKFEHNVSVIDLILNEGIKSAGFLKD